MRTLTTLSTTALLLLAAAGCSDGGAGPTAPTGAGIVIQTSYGPVQVDTGGHDFDPAEAVEAIERGYAQAREQIGAAADRHTLNGMRVVVRSQLSQPAYGVYHPASDQVEVLTGVERVLRHELQHRFCYRMNLPEECCFLQDHPGGYDLSCRKI